MFRKLASTRMQVDTCQRQLTGQARTGTLDYPTGWDSQRQTVGTQVSSRAVGACDEPELVQILESGERARAWY